MNISMNISLSSLTVNAARLATDMCENAPQYYLIQVAFYDQIQWDMIIRHRFYFPKSDSCAA
jgi:hypothetical protein